MGEAGGTGSQEIKIRLIGELVDSLTGKGAKYAVKMILGKLRTGFSDMTVLDALSWMIGVDKKLRPEIEAIYNIRADLAKSRLSAHPRRHVLHQFPRLLSCLRTSVVAVRNIP